MGVFFLCVFSAAKLTHEKPLLFNFKRAGEIYESENKKEHNAK